MPILLSLVVTSEAAEVAKDSTASRGLPEDESLSVAVTIDSENLIDLYQSVPDLQIIDSRHYQDHTQGYIENSHNLPVALTSCDSLRQLAKNKDQVMVFYSNGRGVDSSFEAIQVASDCGYKRLFWLRGGFIEWEEKDYPFLIK